MGVGIHTYIHTYVYLDWGEYRGSDHDFGAAGRVGNLIGEEPELGLGLRCMYVSVVGVQREASHGRWYHVSRIARMCVCV